MNIINIEHISKLFGDKLIFDDASFGLQEGDKVGIVGINGTGKSTLLRMAAGEETPDSGQIIRQNNLKMAYLPQTPEFPKDATVLSYALSGDEEDWQVQSNLVQLGITEYDAKIDTLWASCCAAPSASSRAASAARLPWQKCLRPILTS